MGRQPWVAAALLVAVLAPAPRGAHAARPRFEPTDLEWEDTGVFELDLQVGPVKGTGAWRVVVPDFELDLGLLPWLEIDIDGAYAIEGAPDRSFSFDHSAPDSLWPSVKLGLYGLHDYQAKVGGALGLQIGPKLPIASGAHGMGIESLLIAGGMLGRVTLALNFGAFVDPSPAPAVARPTGVELGVDLQLRLDDRDRFGLTGEVAGTHFTSVDPDQLQATVGFVWTVRPTLDLSLTGLRGNLAGGDRYAVLLGISPKWQLFSPASPAH